MRSTPSALFPSPCVWAIGPGAIFLTLTPTTYYVLLEGSKDFPTTSQPSPQAFIDAFAPFVEKGEPILSIQISSKLSGTYQSASLARSHFPEALIEVVDSFRSPGPGHDRPSLRRESGRGRPVRGSRRICPRSGGPGGDVHSRSTPSNTFIAGDASARRKPSWGP